MSRRCPSWFFFWLFLRFAGLPLPVSGAGTIAPHPRIWLNASRLADLKTRAAANDPSYLAMKAAIDRYNMTTCNLAPAPDSDGMALPASMALMYKITGNTLYGTCAIAQEKKNLSYFTPSGFVPGVPCTVNCPFQSDNDYRNMALQAAVVFDWCYDLFTATDKLFYVDRMRATASYHMSPTVLYDTGGNAGKPGNNLYAGQVSRTALIGYALYGDEPTDNSVTQTNFEISAVMLEYSTNIKPFFTTGYGVGGALPEGPEYSPQVYQYYTEWFDGALTATGLDIYADLGNFAQQAVKF